MRTGARGTEFDEILLLGQNFLRCLRNFGGDGERNNVHAVPIAVDQVARRNGAAADFDGLAVFGNVGVLVSDGNAAGEEVKAEGFHFGQVSHGTVGDVADTVQGEPDGGVKPAHEGAVTEALVDVLDNHDSRFGYRGEVTPPAYVFVIAAAVDRGGAGAKAACGSVAEHWREGGELAADGRAGDRTLIAHPDVESFDGVRNETGIELADGIEGGWREDRGCVLSAHTLCG